MPGNLREGMARLMSGCSPQGWQKGNDRQIHDSPPRRWTLVTGGECPTARSGHSAVVAGGKAYIFGGCGRPVLKSAVQPTEDMPAPVCLGDLHAFDLARQTWETIHAAGAMWPAVARTCAAMCASENEEKLYLSGGAGDDPDDLRADLLEYDLRRRTWSLLFDGSGCSSGSTDACRRIGHSIVHDPVRNRLVIFGGSTGFEYFDDTYVFNLVGGIWAPLATFGDRPSPRYKHQAFVDSDAMYVLGGGSFEPEGSHLDVYRLHLGGPRALEWERVHPMGNPPRCRAAHGLAWDREARTAYIWGGFTMGMELDSLFHALRLPPLPPSATTESSSSPGCAHVSADNKDGRGQRKEVMVCGGEEEKVQELSRGRRHYPGERWYGRQDHSSDDQSRARGRSQGWGSGRRRNLWQTRDSSGSALGTGQNSRPLRATWLNVPDREWGWAPCPPGRSFHCAFFHAGSCYVTGGSDGSRKFGDMWRYTVRETPPPLATLAARAVSAAAARRKEQGRGGQAEARMDLPEEVRAALATLNMQAKVVL
ncbi:unnamed protein product [Choristocarpus tenellus]